MAEYKLLGEINKGSCKWYLVEDYRQCREWLDAENFSELINNRYHSVSIERQEDLCDNNMVKKAKVLGFECTKYDDGDFGFEVWHGNKLAFIIIPYTYHCDEEIDREVDMGLLQGAIHEACRQGCRNLKFIGGKGLTNLIYPFGSIPDHLLADITVDLSDFDLGALKHGNGIFSGLTISKVIGIDKVNLSNIEDAYGLFSESIIDTDLKLDLANATDLGELFEGSIIKDNTTLEILAPKAKDLKMAFKYCKVKKLDLNGINTSKAEKFTGCFDSAIIEELNISNWEYNECGIWNMFRNAKIKELNLGKFNSLHIKAMMSAFENLETRVLNIPEFIINPNLAERYYESLFRNCEVQEIKSSWLYNEEIYNNDAKAYKMFGNSRPVINK